MTLRISGVLAIAAFALASVLGSAQSLAQNAYITNFGSNTVSVINTATNTVTATIPVGVEPHGVAVPPDGNRVYVTNAGSNSVSVFATATNTVTATIPVGVRPIGVAVPPDGTTVYVTNAVSNSVSVIDTTTNTVSATIPDGVEPIGVAVTPDGSRVYVVNGASNSVSVIDTASNTVIGSPIPVGSIPEAFGVFIQPPKAAPKFAGIPGHSNCHGQSVSALAKQYGGLNNAAAALGFDSVKALQDAILAFCGG
jgi:YVTN family beta-propeller protein